MTVSIAQAGYRSAIRRAAVAAIATAVIVPAAGITAGQAEAATGEGPVAVLHATSTARALVSQPQGSPAALGASVQTRNVTFVAGQPVVNPGKVVAAQPAPQSATPIAHDLDADGVTRGSIAGAALGGLVGGAIGGALGCLFGLPFVLVGCIFGYPVGAVIGIGIGIAIGGSYGGYVGGKGKNHASAKIVTGPSKIVQQGNSTDDALTVVGSAVKEIAAQVVQAAVGIATQFNLPIAKH